MADLDDARLTAEEALAMLPDGGTVRVARQPVPGVVTVADWPRAEAEALVRAGDRRKAGPRSVADGFGLAVVFSSFWAWIETRPVPAPAEEVRTVWGLVPMTEAIGDAW